MIYSKNSYLRKSLFCEKYNSRNISVLDAAGLVQQTPWLALVRERWQMPLVPHCAPSIKHGWTCPRLNTGVVPAGHSAENATGKTSSNSSKRIINVAIGYSKSSNTTSNIAHTVWEVGWENTPSLNVVPLDVCFIVESVDNHCTLIVLTM